MRNTRRKSHSQTNLDQISDQSSDIQSESEPTQNKKKESKALSETSTTESSSEDDDEVVRSEKKDIKSVSNEEEEESNDEEGSENSDSDSESESNGEYSTEETAETEEEEIDDPTVYQYSKEYGLIRRSTRQRKQTQFSSDSDSDVPVRKRSMARNKKNAKNKKFTKRQKGRRGRKPTKGKRSNIVQKKKTGANNSGIRGGMLTRMSLRQNVKKTKFSSDDDEENSYSANEYYSSDSSEEIEETETEDIEESEPEEEEKEESIQYIIGKKDVFTDHVTDNATDNVTDNATDNPTDNATDNTENETDDVNEYYVKFNDKSYIHCRWMKKDEILSMKGGENAFRRWNNRSRGVELEHSMSFPSLLTVADSDTNSLWIEVDRIIDEKGDGNNRMYHVKWKGLPYDESTWEKECDVPQDKIDQFHERLDRSNPIKIPSRYKRPSPDSFEEIKEPIATPDGELTLRPYQMEGFNWLRSRWYNNLNSILADEMGLGKTVQVVCALNDLALHEGISGPFLVIAPLSTLPHWQMEFERWTKLNVVVYHGNQQSRDLIRQTEFVVVNEEGETVKNVVQFDVLITNYETVLSDFNVFNKIEWRYLVLDEAHRLKNSKGILYQKMETLQFEYCVMLTGTPIQNRIDELWSLLHFLFPSKFDDLEGFKERYENPTSSKQVEEIQAIINPIILRRKKSDVEKTILPKEETIIDVELSREQKNLYKALFNRNANLFFSKIKGGALPALQNLMMQLRKVCNHPYLIRGAEQAIIHEKKEQYKNQNKSLEEIELLAMIESSGKMILIDKLLPRLREDHHKVLIFSQMVRVLDIIEDYLDKKGYPNERIDGSKSDRERQTAIDKFNEDENAFVFLLSTRAGGVGINLTTADTVIIFDSDWNPQNDIQAEARCHRIGQKSKVKVYRLIMKDTYESKMFETASKKLGLDHAILDGDLDTSDDKNSKTKKAQEIEEMLRNGIHSIFKDDDNEIDNFSSADIDQILERRAKSVIEDVVTGGGSVFAHAKFNITNDDKDKKEDEEGAKSKDNDADTKDFWKDYLDSSQNQFNEHLTIRRCRKNQLDKSTSFETLAVRRAITNLMNRGYRGQPNEIQIIKYASKETNFVEENYQKLFESVFGKDTSDDDDNSDKEENKYGNKYDNDNDLVYDASLLSRSESSNFTPSSSMSFSNLNEEESNMKIGKINVDSESAYIIEEKSSKIIERVLFFVRIERILLYVQQENNFNWPLISPSWKGPDSDYALLLAYFIYGKHNLLEHILSDEGINAAIQVKHDPEGNPVQTKFINSKSFSRRISQLVDELEEQIPKEYFALSVNSILSSEDFPAESRKEVEVNGNTFYKFVPMSPTLWKEKHSRIMSRANLEDSEINELTTALIAYGLPRDFHKKADSNDEFADVDLEKLRELANLHFISIEAIKSTAHKIVKLAEEKEPDMTQMPMLTEYKLKRVKTSVHDMEKIYKFAYKLRHDSSKNITEAIKKLDKFQDIEWWNYECDIALINSIAKYGLMKYAIWMIDQDLPFYKHIPSDALEAFASAAASEKKKMTRVIVNYENIPSDISLLKEKARIDRIKFVIRSVHKIVDSKKKEQKSSNQLGSIGQLIASNENKNTFFMNVINNLENNQNNPNNVIQILSNNHENQTSESIALNDIKLLEKNQSIKISKNIELVKIGSLVTPYDKHYEGKSVPFPIGYTIKRDFKRKEWPKKMLFLAEIEKGLNGPVFKVTITNEQEPVSFTGTNTSAPWKLAFEHIESHIQTTESNDKTENNNSNNGENNENDDDKKGHSVLGATLYGLSSQRVVEILKKLPNASEYPSLKKLIQNDKFKPADFKINLPMITIPDEIDV